jgi:NADH-quinone oxidoreductase subunit A
MTPLVAYVLLFLAVGVFFIFIHLVLGKLIRPNKPDAEKKTIYECGEPTIGSAWIQFDLRFYVVALLFVVFDVEVAFFFPWAEVFGKANNIAALSKPETEADRAKYAARVLELIPPSKTRDRAAYQDLTEERLNQVFEANRQRARTLAWLALVEIGVFFGVLLVGFAYLWRRGDLAWVRSTLAERPAAVPTISTPSSGQTLVGAGS